MGSRSSPDYTAHGLSPTLTIIYATETGNAQDYAGRVAHQCRRAHFKSRVFDIDNYPLSEIVSESVVVFLVSTSGTGKEPRTMTPMWRSLLRSDLPHDFFEDLQYAVFGLGDSSYERFCWPAKKLSRRLEYLGATAICPRAEGDTQHTLGTDGALSPGSSLTDALLRLYPLPPHLSPLLTEELPTPRLRDEPDPLLGDKRNERITANDWYQDVRHFEFRCQDDIAYDPGDVAVIHPEAFPTDVDSFLSRMGWSDAADDPIRIRHIFEDQSLPSHLPQVSTLRVLFTRHLDIHAVPKRSFFRLLKHFATDEREREKLEEFSSPDGAVGELYEYTTRVRRTIGEVLGEFRSFSIASASLAHPHEVHLCVAIVDYKTKLKARRRGVGTSFLASLPLGMCETADWHHKRPARTSAGFDHPSDLHWAGNGSGTCAGGVRGSRASGRKGQHDAHYSHEWTALAESGNLAYRAAASRDGPEGTRRVYVQDLMRQDAKRIWRLVHDEGAWVYISGWATLLFF
ncbi:hypothetical protein BC826DRAFT_1007321 [Russula brevipes]|nr:hypothetical protein BC826DRAFT_1007321 [Russula brevipes]